MIRNYILLAIFIGLLINDINSTTLQANPQNEPEVKHFQEAMQGQQVHLNKSAQLKPQHKTKQHHIIQLETSQVDALGLNYEHMKQYSFEVENRTDFAIKVDYDHQIKAIFTVYWGDTKTYGQSGIQQGQEVSLTVYQNNNNSVVFTQSCYHKCQLLFNASKEKTYFLHFGTQGRKKLILMLIQNFVSERKGDQKLFSSHIKQNQESAIKFYQQYKAIYSSAKSNFATGLNILKDVSEHSKGYIRYQFIEMLLICFGAITQLFLMKKLIGPSSVV